MKKQILRKEKGITLIALVITIIVLLILAGVTIATLTGDNGILQQAQNVKIRSTQGEEEEQIRLGYSEYQISKKTGGNEKLKVEGATVTGTDGDWTITFPSNSYTFDGTTITLKGGSNSSGGYTQNGDTITTPDGKEIKVGDHVDYDPTLGANASDLTYSSPSSKTGADSNQDFNAATYENAGYGWRVLGVSNGKVRLISEEFVGAGTYSDSNRTYYTLKGKNGYINGIDELKTISAIFGHGKGAESATSITVDDINAITGYNPKTAKYGEGYFYEYGNKVTYTRGDETAISASATNGKTWSGSSDTFNYYDKSTKTFVSLTSGSTEITSTACYYNSTNLSTASNEPATQGVDENGVFNDVYQMLFGKWTIKDVYGNRSFTGTGAQMSFWLSSDAVLVNGGEIDWGISYVQFGDVCRGSLYEWRCYCTPYELGRALGVRPVLTLKSDVSLEWNDIAKEWKIK